MLSTAGRRFSALLNQFNDGRDRPDLRKRLGNIGKQCSILKVRACGRSPRGMSRNEAAILVLTMSSEV